MQTILGFNVPFLSDADLVTPLIVGVVLGTVVYVGAPGLLDGSGIIKTQLTRRR